MVSTVTTATANAVSSSTLSASFTLVAILLLLVLSIGKEIVSDQTSPRMQRLSRALDITLLPLGFGFVFAAVVRIIEVLG